jgi:hypothetical protein
MSPTARTLAAMRAAGYVAEKVEYWNPHARVRKDLFGGIDIVAVADGPGGRVQIWGVQATSGTNHGARVVKLLAEPKLRRWVACGGLLSVVSWRKLASGRWAGRRTDLLVSGPVDAARGIGREVFA